MDKTIENSPSPCPRGYITITSTKVRVGRHPTMVINNTSIYVTSPKVNSMKMPIAFIMNRFWKSLILLLAPF